MANYYGYSRTNYFKVTDEEKYKTLFSYLSSKSNVEDFTYINQAGETLHGFGAYDSIFYYPHNDEDEWEEFGIEEFLEDLKDILTDDSAAVYFEVGYEKLRYLTGYSLIAVKGKDIKCVDLEHETDCVVKDLLGDKYTEQQYAY